MLERKQEGVEALYDFPAVVSDHRHRTATFSDEHVSLATVDERIEADYILPDEDSDTPHSEYLFSDESETTGTELDYSNGEWVLHVHCKKELESDTSKQHHPRTELERFLVSGLTSA